MPEQIVVTAAPIVHVSDFLSPSDGFNLWEWVVLSDSSLGIVECFGRGSGRGFVRSFGYDV